MADTETTNKTTWVKALTGTDSETIDIEKLREENATPTVFTAPLGTSDEKGEGDVVNLHLDQSDHAHGAIVGCSGSGKSAALGTLLWGLGIKYSPEVLEFVFASGKGPASPACSLANTRGIFNIADPVVAGEFLDYVQDMVAQREAFAEEHGLEIVTPADLPAVLIIAEEVWEAAPPEVMEALSLVATRGRELGIHFILVGQRLSSRKYPVEVVNNIGWAVAFSEFEDEARLARPAEGFGKRVKPGVGFVLDSEKAQGVAAFLLGPKGEVPPVVERQYD